MKKLSFILLSLMILVSCRSMTSKGRSVNTAEKQMKNGNYYEAILNLSNALIADPDYKPAIEGLNSIFTEAISNQEEKVSLMKTTSSLTDYATEVEKMSLIYKNLSRLRPESFNLLNFKLEIEDIKFWNNETSKAYYDAAINYSKPQTSFDYKAITKLYKKSYQYNPRYQDNFEKYKQNKELSMQKILYFDIKSEYNYFNIGSLLKNSIISELTKDSDIMEFTNFINGDSKNLKKSSILSKSFTENELKENNYFLDIEISSISFPRINPTTTYKSKTWYEVSKNISGIIKKDAILTLPKNLDPNATYTENKYTEIKTYKESSVKMILTYKLIDLKTKNLIKSGSINDEVKDSHTSTAFIGNVYPNEYPVLDRALSSDSNLLEAISTKISEKLKNELKPVLE